MPSGSVFFPFACSRLSEGVAMVRLRFAFLGLVAAIALAACSGGGSSVTTSAAPPSTGSPGNAKIFVPSARTTASRGPRFVSASGNSVKITTNGGTPTFADISNTSPACSAASGGRTCSVPLSALPGAATFVFAIYDGAAGAGALLGGGTATQTIVANTPFTVSVTLDGVVGSVAVTLPSASFLIGSSSTAAVSVIAKDPDGNTIIAPGNYTSPIMLSNSDTSGAFKLSTTTVNGPSDAITLSYTGAALTAPITIAPLVTGLSGSTLGSATVTTGGVLPSSLKYTETSTVTSSYTQFNTPTSSPSTTPYPAPSPQTSTYMYSHVLTSGVTFGTYTGAYDDKITTTSSTTPSTQDRFYALVPNGSSQTYTQIGSSSTSTITSGTYSYLITENLAFASVPFVDGASIAADPSSSATFSYAPAPAASPTSTGPYSASYSSTSTEDKVGNSTYGYTTSYSTLNQVDSADGSGSIMLTNAPGFSSLSALKAAVSPPSDGNVNVTIVQTPTSGRPVTTNLTIPVATIYPNGIPPARHSIVSTVSTKSVSLPAACAVPASIATGPIVMITVVTAGWTPSSGYTFARTETTYFSSGFGVLCMISDATSSSALNLQSLTSSTPTVASVTQYGLSTKDHQVTYVTGLTTSSHGRGTSSGVLHGPPLVFTQSPHVLLERRFATGASHLEVPR